jgi:RNase P subunit RPR2
MTDRIVCSCITCPKCGTWVVVEREMTRETNKEKLNTTCPGPECGKQFSFAAGETKVFELPMSLFERRHFYRSELV